MGTWQSWCAWIFSTPEAKNRPWQKLGIHPMRWASQRLQSFEAQTTGYGDPSDFDSRVRVAASPEEIMIAREDAAADRESAKLKSRWLPEVYETRARLYQAPNVDRPRYSRSRCWVPMAEALTPVMRLVCIQARREEYAARWCRRHGRYFSYHR